MYVLLDRDNEDNRKNSPFILSRKCYRLLKKKLRKQDTQDYRSQQLYLLAKGPLTQDMKLWRLGSECDELPRAPKS